MIFTYSLILTAGVSFLAVLIIPDEVRMKDYADNLLGGLAMHVIGPASIRVGLNAIVVAAGFLILSGAVNTSIIGSNGVLNRVAEDGVLPDRLQKPHPKYGTTHRILYLIVGLQLFTIVASGGDMVLLGEAYAFGVIWSFFFNAVSMLVLRFKDKRVREFKVPLNIRIGDYEIPVGLLFVFTVLGSTAVINLFTKEVATIGGLTFSSISMAVFVITEPLHAPREQGECPRAYRTIHGTFVGRNLRRNHRIDQALSQGRRDSLAAKLVHAAARPGRVRSGDHGRDRHDGQDDAGRRCRAEHGRARSLRPQADDRRDRAGREIRQAHHPMAGQCRRTIRCSPS